MVVSGWWLVVLGMQLAAPNAAGVAMGHLHYHVRDVEATSRFWVALGGTAETSGNEVVLKFADVFVVLSRGESSGGTEGTVVNHVAFRVPSLSQVESAGLVVARLERFPGVASVISPEGERIELFEDAALNLTFTADEGELDAPSNRHNRPVGAPIAFHHVHLHVPAGQVGEAKAWYARTFGGVPGRRSSYEAVDLPGINLNFSEAPRPAAPTAGRMLDHIGFEIRGLEAFCRRLEAMGIVFDAPYTADGGRVRTARLTDPWGTSIELTEGLK
jgi:catechol 2,3-dioxygenase-like lactoylglutathione lyase family enzyme